MAALLRRVRRRTAGAANEWTVARWHEELARLRRLSVRRDLGLHRAHPAVYDLPDGSVVVIGPPQTVTRVDPPPPPKIGDTVKGPMLVYPDRSSEPREVNGAAVGPLLAYPGQPGAPRRPEALQDVGFLLRWDHCPALVISLVGASDEHIRATARVAVDEALRERAARRTGSALPCMTAPNSPTRAFADRTAFTKWRDNNISELAELLAWRKRLPKVERRKYPEHKLGSWAFDKPIPAQRTSLAKEVLRDALGCVWEMLPEQLEVPAAPAS